MRLTCAGLAVLTAVAGCAVERSVGYDETAQVAGTFDVTLINGANGCALSDWNQGAVSLNIPVTIEQQGTSVTANVGGLAGIAVALGYGSAAYVGQVDGHSMALSVRGTTMSMRGACQVVWTSGIQATVAGDFLQGTVNHRPAAVDPACPVDPCATVQTFNGHRPPTR